MTGPDPIRWARSLGCVSAVDLHDTLGQLARRGSAIVEDLTGMAGDVRDVPDDAITSDITRAIDSLGLAVLSLREAQQRLADVDTAGSLR